MSAYSERIFPLEPTSTIYMSGKAVYNLRRYGQPGIISSVELFPADAATFALAVKEAMAGVWDVAFEAGWKECHHEHSCGDNNPDVGNAETANPYDAATS